MLRQTCKSQLYERQETKPNQTESQWDVASRHQGLKLKTEDDTIRRLKKKEQTDAKKIRKLEQEIRQKDQSVERLNRLLDQHSLDSKSDQNSVSVVSAIEVYIVKFSVIEVLIPYLYGYINLIKFIYFVFEFGTFNHLIYIFDMKYKNCKSMFSSIINY